MKFILPVKRLRETQTLLAFNHPEPTYPIHILLVPKRQIGTLLELDKDDTVFLQDVISTAQSLVTELGIERLGYRLILNGGDYQKVPYLHFHLVSEFEAGLPMESNTIIDENHHEI